MNHLHRFARWIIRLYARSFAAWKAWTDEGHRISEVEDAVDESMLARMMDGIEPNTYCRTCQVWNGHAGGCAWLAAHNELVRKDRMPANAPQKED